MKNLWLIAILLAAAPLATSATYSDAGLDCANDGMCQSRRCVSGVCAARSTIGGPCGSNDDCEGGLACDNGNCAALPGGIACSDNADCGEGQICNVELSQCQTPPSFEPEPLPIEDELAVPRLQIPLPTLQPFTKPYKTVTEAGKTAYIIKFLAEYIVAIYRYLVGIASIMAGVMIVWAGLKWLTSAGSPERIGEAKKKIAGALVGLVLVLGSYVILNIINPELTLFKPLQVEYVERILLSLEEQEEEETAAVEGTVCNTVEACRVLCSKPRSQWPTSTTTTIPFEETIAIPSNIAGLQATPGVRVTQTMLTNLIQAAQIAQQRSDGPYTIKVTSGYRSLEKQISLVCDKIAKTDRGEYDINKIGTATAWPGGSNHGSGKAVDVQFWRGSRLISCSGCYDTQTQAQWSAGTETLADIMFETGFVRYCKEIWHFELQTSSPCRSNTCRNNVIECP